MTSRSEVRILLPQQAMNEKNTKKATAKAGHKQTIEGRVADAVLQRDLGEVEIAGEKYRVAAPTLATLITISEIISELPVVEEAKGMDALYSVLHYAKDYRKLGDIAAVLILGAKKACTKSDRLVVKKRLFGLIRKEYITKSDVEVKDRLSEQIIDTMSPTELWTLITKLLGTMEVGSFFGIITSLSAANMLRPTKTDGEVMSS